MNMRDRVVIVTGGAGTIGKGIVKRFHDEGARVAVVDQTEEKITKAYDAIGISPDERLPVVGDVALEQTSAEMVRRTLERFGRLDAVVTSVFWSKGGDSTAVTLEDWNRCLAVTLTSTFLAAKHAVPAILSTAGRGSLTAISSVHGAAPGRNYAMYATAKAGLNMLVRALALDYGEKGVRVNAVAPGATSEGERRFDQATNPALSAVYVIGRAVRADEIAGAVLFLASDEAAAITGQVLAVDGGCCLALQEWLAAEVNRRVKAAG